MRQEQGLAVFFFFFNDTATTEIYTLSLHDALPISTFWDGTPDNRAGLRSGAGSPNPASRLLPRCIAEEVETLDRGNPRSEEHTSELQSHLNIVCRLLLEKKKSKEP